MPRKPLRGIFTICDELLIDVNRRGSPPARDVTGVSLSNTEAAAKAVAAARDYAKRLRSDHADRLSVRQTAIAAGREPGKKPRLPTVSAACVDTQTGRTYVGHAAEKLAVPPQLRAALPPQSSERWSTENCAEVKAASRAVTDGARLDDLITRAVTTRTDEFREPCGNCEQWTR